MKKHKKKPTRGKHHCSGDLWECRCECGNIVHVCGACLQAGHVTSCGKCPDPAEPKVRTH